MTTAIRIPWPAGRFAVARLGDVREGAILAPVQWEAAFMAGQMRHLPFVTVRHRPIHVRVMPPGAAAMRPQVKVSCRPVDAEPFYYTGHPETYVRVIIPRGQK